MIASLLSGLATTFKELAFLDPRAAADLARRNEASRARSAARAAAPRPAPLGPLRATPVADDRAVPRDPAAFKAAIKDKNRVWTFLLKTTFNP